MFSVIMLWDVINCSISPLQTSSNILLYRNVINMVVPWCITCNKHKKVFNKQLNDFIYTPSVLENEISYIYKNFLNENNMKLNFPQDTLVKASIVPLI